MPWWWCRPATPALPPFTLSCHWGFTEKKSFLLGMFFLSWSLYARLSPSLPFPFTSGFPPRQQFFGSLGSDSPKDHTISLYHSMPFCYLELWPLIIALSEATVTFITERLLPPR